MSLFGKKKEEKKEISCGCSCCCGCDVADASEKSTPHARRGEKVDGICDIKMLGSGCKNCHTLYENAVKAVKAVGIDVEVEYITDTTGLITKKLKPNFKTLGKKYGKQMKEIAAFFGDMDQTTIAAIERAGEYTLALPSGDVVLATDDYTISSEDMEGWLVASEGQLTVALDVTITDELRREGVARELVNRIQNLRKDSGFDVTDRINVTIENLPEVADSLASFADYLKDQTLAINVTLGKDFGGRKVEWEDDGEIEIKVEKIV